MGKGGLPVLSRRFLALTVLGAVGVLGVSCWITRPTNVPVVESPTTIATTAPVGELTLTPTPFPAPPDQPPTATPIVIYLPPSIQTVIVLTTPTPQATRVPTPEPTATPTPTPNADSSRALLPRLQRGCAQPSPISHTSTPTPAPAVAPEPTTVAVESPHARVRDADTIPD